MATAPKVAIPGQRVARPALAARIRSHEVVNITDGPAATTVDGVIRVFESSNWLI